MLFLILVEQDLDTEMLTLAAAAMGASAAIMNNSVPGATASTTGFPSSCPAWRDPSSLLTGPGSIRATMHLVEGDTASHIEVQLRDSPAFSILLHWNMIFTVSF